MPSRSYKPVYRRKRWFSGLKTAKSPEITTKKTVAGYATKHRYRKFNGRMGHAVNRLLKGIEIKYHEIYQAYTPSETMGLHCLTSIAEGDTESTRTGTSIYAKKIHVKCVLAGDDYATNNQRMFCRVLLLEDKESYITSGVPLNTDIFNNTTSAKTMVTGFHIWFGSRFHCLFDKVFQLQEIGSGSSQKYFEISRRLGRVITYTGAADTACCKNHLWLIWLVCSPTGSIDTNHEAHLLFTSRLYFTDS